MQDAVCILDLPDSIAYNLMKYLSDKDTARVNRTSSTLNSSYSQLTGSNNYYWITRLEEAFEKTATKELIDKLHGVDLEKVYKNLDVDNVPNMHEGNIDLARVLLAFWCHHMDYLREELVNASSHGFYELAELLLNTLIDREVDERDSVVLSTAISSSIEHVSSGECYIKHTFAKSHLITLQLLLPHKHRVIDMQKAINEALLNVSKAPYDEPEIAKLLVSEAQGLDINMTKALENACEEGHYNVIECLLKNDVKPTNTALAGAACSGYTDVITLLMTYGARPLYTQDEALPVAILYGHIDVVVLLLDYGVDPNEYNSLAFDAARNGHVDILKLLVSRGAYPLYNNGIALRSGHVAQHTNIVELMLTYLDKLPTLNDELVENIYELVSSLSDKNVNILERILTFLSKRGRLLNKKLNEFLFNAVGNEHLRVIKILLRYGADPTSYNGEIIELAGRIEDSRVRRAIADATRPRGKR